MVEEVRTVVVEGVLVVCDVEVVVEEVEISGGGAPISEAQVQYISLSKLIAIHPIHKPS